VRLRPAASGALRLVAVLSVLLGLASVAAADQDVTSGWESSVLYEVQSYSEDRGTWHTYRLAFRKRFEKATVGVEALRTHRFEDDVDEALALDVVAPLWHRAYGNVRFQAAINPKVLPSTDAWIEVYQGFGSGWEVSGGYRNLDVPEGMVHVPALGLGKYIGNWYFRQRTTISIADGDANAMFSGAARYFLRAPEDWLQVEGGTGREVVDVARGPVVESRRVDFVGLRAQKFFAAPLGVAGGVTYRTEHGGPNSVAGVLEVLVRW
jgi:YaiO family outer membrane protein